MSGLYGKYAVFKSGERITDCFVLRPEKDPAALKALLTYAFETPDQQLMDDLLDWAARIDPPRKSVVNVACPNCGAKRTLAPLDGKHMCFECDAVWS